MWVEEFKIENIRCFEKETSMKFTRNKGDPYKWITLIGENGGGKSTVLQALSLLLTGPQGVTSLLPRPEGWVRDENKAGKIGIRIHQGKNDPGQFGVEKIVNYFGYSFFITGNSPINISNKNYSEPTIGANPGQKPLSWLRKNAFTPKGKGWFAAGYGAFRRLTRKSQILIPSLAPQSRYTNFLSQINEDTPLSTFENWMVHLDYRISKSKDKHAKELIEIGIEAIEKVLPDGIKFSKVSSDGKIIFNLQGQEVPTISMSDGYRSILALSGDLIWRLINAFPDSNDPLKEEGVVLIDELDIHLHPTWQRFIAGWLRKQFPNIQFIVATHSPFIAGGAGEDSLIYRLTLKESKAVVNKVQENLSLFSVDNILLSPAFELVSSFSPQTQEKIDRYDDLNRRRDQLDSNEKNELDQLDLFMQDAIPFSSRPKPGSLEDKMNRYLEEKLR